MDIVKNYLEENSIPVPETGCWIWTHTLSRGYGQVSMFGNHYRAHRVSYEQYKGKIPRGLNVCHSCDTPSCINPDHLFVGTQAENIQDMDQKGRRRTKAHKGEENGNSKLSAEVVKGIFDANGSQRAIAKEFGVSQRLVWNIKHKKTWTHIHN